MKLVAIITVIALACMSSVAGADVHLFLEPSGLAGFSNKGTAERLRVELGLRFDPIAWNGVELHTGLFADVGSEELGDAVALGPFVLVDHPIDAKLRGGVRVGVAVAEVPTISVGPRLLTEYVTIGFDAIYAVRQGTHDRGYGILGDLTIRKKPGLVVVVLLGALTAVAIASLGAVN